jgi:hypothetical protein
MEITRLFKHVLPLYLLPLIALLVIRSVWGNQPEFVVPLGTSLAFIYYLLLDNPNKQYLKQIAVCIGLMPLLSILPSNWQLDGFFMGLLAASAGSFYTLRYFKKPNRNSILEIIKLVTVILFCVSYVIAEEFIGPANVSLGFVYLVTRVLQSPNQSKIMRNVISALLILVTIFFIVFANIKASEAEKSYGAARENQQLAKEKSEELDVFRKKTDERLNKLMSRMDSLESQLSNCQSGR